MKKNFSSFQLFLRSVTYHRRLFFLCALGAALTAMVITGALIIGDSVKTTLKNLGENRLGIGETGVFTTERWFRSKITEPLKKKIPWGKFGALISLPAYAATSGEATLSVSLYGVDENFFSLAPSPPGTNLKIKAGEIFLNPTAAALLKVKEGDPLVIRYLNPSRMPGDAPLSPRSLSTLGSRMKIARILDGSHFGDFNPQTTQQLRPNLFMDREYLANQLKRPGRANLLLTDQSKNLRAALKEVLQPTDYGLHLRRLENQVELTTDRVFLAPAVDRAARSLKISQERIFCYFVNTIRVGKKSIPYSFVAGVDDPFVSSSLGDNEIILNDWAVSQLGCRVGDSVQLTAFKIGDFGSLREESSTFTLKEIASLADAGRTRNWMPSFPGMEKADSCKNWDPTLPIDLSRIRPADEAYWTTYRGTPKGFITLKTAGRLWGSRFGNLTAIRFQSTRVKEMEQSLRSGLDPQDLGFVFRSLKREKDQGVAGAVDFGGLFLALSFFVIVAALILSGLLFSFYLENRQQEYGLLQTLGFSHKSLRRQYGAEGLLCSFTGSIPGAVAGVFYGWLMLKGLSTLWRGAVNAGQIELVISPIPIIIGILSSVLVVMGSIYLSLRKFIKSSGGAMVRGETALKGLSPRKHLIKAVLFLIPALILIVFAPRGSDPANVAAFFGVGVLLLLGTLQGSAWILSFLSSSQKKLTLTALAWKGSVRRPGRSLAIINSLAWTIFLLLAVSVNRQGMTTEPFDPKSGTGGFGFVIETALPMPGNLNSQAEREGLKMDGLDREVNFVQLAYQPGSEASCLNLNRVIRPTLAGVNPASLAGRFSFESTLADTGREWEVLNYNPKEADVIPVVADMAVIQWILGKKIGDKMEYENSSGKKYHLLFAGGLKGSIFQGMVLVSLKNFYQLFPDGRGSSMALVNSPEKAMEATKKIIGKSLDPFGLNLETTASRLNRFNSVQNTYLAIFMALGGIGLVLGCVGLAILLRRNLLERQQELTYLTVLGYSRAMIQRMVFTEHLVLFLLALVSGLLSASAALIPVLTSPTGRVPLGEMAFFCGLVLLFGVLSLMVVNRWKPQGELKDL